MKKMKNKMAHVILDILIYSIGLTLKELKYFHNRLQ